ALAGHDPPRFDHRDDAPKILRHADPVLEAGDAALLFPGPDDLSLNGHHLMRAPAERQERLDLPAILSPERRRGLEAEGGDGERLRGVPEVELPREARPVEAVGRSVERGPRFGLDLEAGAEAPLEDVVLLAVVIDKHNLVFGERLLDQEAARKVQL